MRTATSEGCVWSRQISRKELAEIRRLIEWRLLHPILNVSHNYRERDVMRAYTLNGRELCISISNDIHNAYFPNNNYNT